MEPPRESAGRARAQRVVTQRVLALIDTVQVSGPGRQLAAVIPALREAGAEVLVVVFRRVGRPVSPYETFLTQKGLPFAVVEEHGPFDRHVIARTRAVVDAFQPTVVQTHGYKPGAVTLAMRWQGLRLPWVAFFHGSTTENLKVRAYHAIDQWVMRFADRVIVMSKAHAQAFPGARSRVQILYNAAIEPLGTMTTRAPIQSPPRLAVIGRLSSEKGVDILLRACALLRARGVSFALDIVGDGPSRGELDALVDALGLRSDVQFVGHLADVDPIYARSALVVIPSRSEGLPNVLLEAIRRDVPTVATTVGAIPEVLETSSAGVMCAPGDATLLADAIATALAPGFAERGRDDRRQIADRFSVPNRATQLLTVYATVTSAVSGATPTARVAAAH